MSSKLNGRSHPVKTDFQVRGDVALMAWFLVAFGQDTERVPKTQQLHKAQAQTGEIGSNGWIEQLP